jgi:hypothetical protein
MKKRNSMEQQQPAKPRRSTVQSSPKWMFWWFYLYLVLWWKQWSKQMPTRWKPTAPMFPTQNLPVSRCSLPSVLYFSLWNPVCRMAWINKEKRKGKEK